MTYFGLRKGDTEEQPNEAAAEEPVAEEAAEEQAPAVPTLPGALWAGVAGPGRWLVARGRPGAAWTLYAGSAWAAGFYGGWTTAGICLGWLATVLLFTPKEYLDQLTDAIERRFSGRPEAPSSTPASTGGEAIRGLLLDLIGEGRGVHLRTVLAHLQEHGQWEGKEVADLRQHLEALGIPVRPKVKVGKTPTRGVLKADLEALPPISDPPPSPAPSPAV